MSTSYIYKTSCHCSNHKIFH